MRCIIDNRPNEVFACLYAALKKYHNRPITHSDLSEIVNRTPQAKVLASIFAENDLICWRDLSLEYEPGPAHWRFTDRAVLREPLINSVLQDLQKSESRILDVPLIIFLVEKEAEWDGEVSAIDEPEWCYIANTLGLKMGTVIQNTAEAVNELLADLESIRFDYYMETQFDPEYNHSLNHALRS